VPGRRPAAAGAVLTALAVCLVTAAAMRQVTSTLPPPPVEPDQPPPADPGLVPVSVAEVKRLFNLLTRTVAVGHPR
jgi:hypothetical protein